MKITIDISPTDFLELPDSRIREQVLYKMGKSITREDRRIIKEGQLLANAALRLQQDRAELVQLATLVREHAPEFMPRNLDTPAALLCLRD
jgi:hypothetical protein